MKKKKNNHLYLSADKRPLFAPVHSVHKTAKDKQNERSYHKQAIRKDLGF